MFTLIKLIELLYTIFLFMILIRILSSWIPELQRKKFLHFIAFYTDPYLNFFRQFIPPLGMIDISSVVALFALSFIKYILIQLVLFIFL